MYNSNRGGSIDEIVRLPELGDYTERDESETTSETNVLITSDTFCFMNPVPVDLFRKSTCH